MALSKYENTQIKAIHVVVPKQKESNIELFGKIKANEFKEKTGICNRLIAGEEENPIFDYALEGAENVLSNLEWDSNSIDHIIFVTQSPDKAFPSLSNRLHGHFNMNSECVCFDINIGCSGFVYGLNVIYSLMQAGQKPFSRSLLFVGDISTSFIPKENNTNRAIFSDAISVTAIEKSSFKSMSFFNLETYGKGFNAIHSKKNGHKEEMIMNGIEVLDYAINFVPKNIHNLLTYSKHYLPETDFIILHQANKLINNFLEKILEIGDNKSLSSLEQIGNTSSASIPVSLVFNKEKINNTSKDYKILLSGFGVGFSIASCLLIISSDCLLTESTYGN
jgi:3-oxoacyl-[acyl-carrier-protein] synthase-3